MIALMLAVVVCCATVDVDSISYEYQWANGQITYRQYLDVRLAWQKATRWEYRYPATDVKELIRRTAIWKYKDTAYTITSNAWIVKSKPTDSIEMRGNIFVNKQRKDWRECLRLYCYALRAWLMFIYDTSYFDNAFGGHCYTYRCQRTGKRMVFDSLGVVQWAKIEQGVNCLIADGAVYCDSTILIADTSGIRRVE